MTAKKRHHRGRFLARAGILAAAAAIGGKLLYQKMGTKNRKKVEGWVKDLKEDSIAILGDAQVLSRKAYHDAIEVASRKYKKLRNIDAKDVERAVREIRGHWKEVEHRLSNVEKAVKKVAKKSVHKVARRRK